MLSLFQGVALGLAQGITELFPVSSLGHSVLLPGLFGWHFDQNAGEFLIFLVATHFATALTLFVIYRRDWFRIIGGIMRSLRDREIAAENLDGKLGWLLVVSTIPAGIIGLLLESSIKKIFVSPVSAAFFLIMNGLLLWVAERLRRKAKTGGDIADADKRIAAELSWTQAFKVGLLQVIALIPGFSRTGSTIAASLMVGLSHEDALRYSFLLATPIIGAAAALELPGLASAGAYTVWVAVAGAAAAVIGAYFSVRFLTNYFKTKTLTPFALYCAAIGLLGLLLLR